MYISGSISHFASRLHQLAENTNDVTTGFGVEGSSYLDAYNSESGKWEKECRLQNYRFTTDPSALDTQVLSQGLPPPPPSPTLGSPGEYIDYVAVEPSGKGDESYPAIVSFIGTDGYVTGLDIYRIDGGEYDIAPPYDFNGTQIANIPFVEGSIWYDADYLNPAAEFHVNYLIICRGDGVHRIADPTSLYDIENMPENGTGIYEIDIGVNGYPP